MIAETRRKFHFIRVIASGGFGTVYLAKELHADGFARVVAIKLLHPKWSENEEIASRMRDEARLLGQIRHKHIVDVRDLTRLDGRVAMVMEYLEAVDVKEIVHAFAARRETMPTRVALEICADAASALDAAYNRPPYAGEKPLRVIHRDIKPSNIMIDDQGTTKVLDFGVARADFQGRESETQELAFGSVEYMPPERLFFEPDSPASDIYSLGATLYEMLANEKFGKAKLRPALHDQHVDARLDAVFADHPMGEDRVKDELDLLLTEMLSFDEADRPSAVDAAGRMRELAGQLAKQPPLATWAPKAIPPLVKVVQGRTSQSDGAELLDRIIEEDSKGFARLRPQDGEPPAPVDLPKGDDSFEALKRDNRPEAIPVLAETAIAPAPKGLGVPPPPPRKAPSDAGRQAAPAGSMTGRAPKPPTPPPPAPTPSPAPMTAERPPPAPTPPTVVERVAPAPEAPPPSRGTGLPVLVAGVMVGLLAVVLVVVGVIAAVAATRGGTGGPVEPPAPDGVEVPAPQPVPDGPTATFVSALPGTAKITVRCGSTSAEGTDRAVVSATDLEACTVTVLDRSRRRLTALVSEPHAGEYRCFEGGESVCQ